ncbi:MAG TPA: hypothetical protein VHY08_12615 [Bacillota bacterium]|nr:hypothetical protein [Bacillota bacterium]
MGKIINFKIKLWLIILGALAVVITIGVIVDSIDQKANGPEQSFAIYNSGDKEVSVTFHRLKQNDEYGGYLDDISVKPGETKYQAYPAGTYKVIVWDGSVTDDNSEEFRSIKNFKVELPDGKDNINPIYIDTTGNYFALINVNYLYSGSALTNQIAESVGASGTGPVLKKLYNGKRPFSTLEQDTDRTIVGPSDKLPDKVSAGESVYILAPVPNTVKTNDEVYQNALRFMETHMQQ